MRNTPEAGWGTVGESAAYARVGKKTIYAAVRAGQLRAARIGGRRSLRIRGPDWVDLWLKEIAEPVEANRGALRVAR